MALGYISIFVFEGGFVHLMDELLSRMDEIEKKLGYVFLNRKLLFLAFVHRSFFNEHRDIINQHNERLEFLGDSVLGLMISDYLYNQLPHETEGYLSLLRSQVVEAGSCARFAHQIGVAQYVLLGRGERMNDGKGKETIVADLFEALIGAIYLDGGLEAAKNFFFGHFEEGIIGHLSRPVRNWKAELQDYSQKKYQKPPAYKVVQEEGPDHGKIFYVIASIGDQAVGEGKGSSKKEAEQAAAASALQRLERPHG